MSAILPKYMIRLMNLALLGCFLAAFAVSAETIFTYRGPAFDGDSRFDYDTALLTLALDKTVEDYGEYQLVSAPEMNTVRTVRALQEQTYPNFFATLSFKKSYLGELDFVPIPTQRGIVGYRLIVASQQVQDNLSKLSSAEELRLLNVVQGEGWLDVDILRQNGFDVQALYSHESLYKFIASQRADILLRGLNEIEQEYALYRKTFPGIVKDPQYVIYYPFPRFFFTHRDNQNALKRINEGLLKAWDDGSFVALWRIHYLRYIKSAELEKRQMLVLNNPQIDGLSIDIDKYMFVPEME